MASQTDRIEALSGELEQTSISDSTTSSTAVQEAEPHDNDDVDSVSRSHRLSKHDCIDSLANFPLHRLHHIRFAASSEVNGFLWHRHRPWIQREYSVCCIFWYAYNQIPR
jgi:hypothetical protein